MEFEQEKEKIRAIFKAKGISENFLELPWVMETILSDPVDTLEDRIQKGDKNNSVIYLTQDNKQMLISQDDNGNFGVLVKDGNDKGSQSCEEIIKLNKYGIEEERTKIEVSPSRVTFIKRDSGTISKEVYEKHELLSEEKLLDLGMCFLKTQGGEINGIPLITFSNLPTKIQNGNAFTSYEFEQTEAENDFVNNVNYYIKRYPKTRDFYKTLAKEVSTILDLSLSYRGAIAENQFRNKVLSYENDSLSPEQEPNKDSADSYKKLISSFVNTLGTRSFEWRNKAKKGANGLHRDYPNSFHGSDGEEPGE